jgi:hypothetical protein
VFEAQSAVEGGAPFQKVPWRVGSCTLPSAAECKTCNEAHGLGAQG